VPRHKKPEALYTGIVTFETGDVYCVWLAVSFSACYS